MAWRFLSFIPALLLAPYAVGADDAPITYRTAIVMSLDLEHRTLTVDAPGGTITALPLDTGVSVENLRPGDHVILGDRTIDGVRRIVLVRRASAVPAPAPPPVPVSDSFA